MTKLYLQRGRSSVLAATTLMTLRVPYERALAFSRSATKAHLLPEQIFFCPPPNQRAQMNCHVGASTAC